MDGSDAMQEPNATSVDSDMDDQVSRSRFCFHLKVYCQRFCLLLGIDIFVVSDLLVCLFVSLCVVFVADFARDKKY